MTIDNFKFLANKVVFSMRDLGRTVSARGEVISDHDEAMMGTTIVTY
jgi:hypothetical protein